MKQQNNNKKRKSGFTHHVKYSNTVTNILAARITHELFQISVN